MSRLGPKLPDTVPVRRTFNECRANGCSRALSYLITVSKHHPEHAARAAAFMAIADHLAPGQEDRRAYFQAQAVKYLQLHWKEEAEKNRLLA